MTKEFIVEVKEIERKEHSNASNIVETLNDIDTKITIAFLIFFELFNVMTFIFGWVSLSLCIMQSLLWLAYFMAIYALNKNSIAYDISNCYLDENTYLSKYEKIDLAVNKLGMKLKAKVTDNCDIILLNEENEEVFRYTNSEYSINISNNEESKLIVEESKVTIIV